MLEIEIYVIGAKRRLCETIQYWSFRKFEIKKESNLNVKQKIYLTFWSRYNSFLWLKIENKNQRIINNPKSWDSSGVYYKSRRKSKLWKNRYFSKERSKGIIVTNILKYGENRWNHSTWFKSSGNIYFIENKVRFWLMEEEIGYRQGNSA